MCLCCWAANLQRLVQTTFKWKTERDLTVKRKALRRDVTSACRSECWVSLVTRGEGECFQGWVTDHSTEPLLRFQVETMPWPETSFLYILPFFLLSSIERVNSFALLLHRFKKKKCSRLTFHWENLIFHYSDMLDRKGNEWDYGAHALGKMGLPRTPLWVVFIKCIVAKPIFMLKWLFFPLNKLLFIVFDWGGCHRLWRWANSLLSLG